MNKKEEIRQHISFLKKQQSNESREEASRKICALLENCGIFKNCSNILLYHSLPDEVETHSLINKWHTQKHIFLPRVKGAELEILAYDEKRLLKGAYNISEPDGEELFDINKIDLIILPAVALDKKGNRIGRGKGYYDKLLSAVNAFKIGIVYSYQLVETIPYEIHDIPVDMVITDEGIIKQNIYTNGFS